MCGIVGYTGDKQAASILLDGLKKLEYRGYDSAGIAVREGDRPLEVVKAIGKLENLITKTEGGRKVLGKCGIGHTRWATHGEPSYKNAHPHLSGNCEGNGAVDSCVVGVHNGIIENYRELREKLQRHGYVFYSDTDTEVVVKLVDYYYKKYAHTPVDAIAKTMVRVTGSYALELMFDDHPGEIWAARKGSPMIIGVGEKESFVASDVPAILSYTRNVYFIENCQCARIAPGKVQFFDLNGDEVTVEPQKVEWDAASAEKGGYEHFMIKEIHEQPCAVRDTYNSFVKEGKVDLKSIGLSEELLKNLTSITVVGCGSAYHVGMVMQYVIEEMAKLPVRVELASEFRYRDPIMNPGQLVVAITQSGETADTLEAVRLAKKRGITTLSIVNVVGSSVARESDYVLYTKAGPEIAVATTKAYSAQLMAGYLFGVELGRARGVVSQKEYEEYSKELGTIPEKIEKILEGKERLQWFATKFAHSSDAFFIGRGIDYAVCMEGSLKMKEISYIHSEAYAAGELKHGTISLIEDNTLVIGVMTQPDLYEKTIGNMAECRSRGAYLMGVVSYGRYDAEDCSNFITYLPPIDRRFAASLAVVPLQLLGYYIAVARGLDVDKPRNLAKSVTVE